MIESMESLDWIFHPHPKPKPTLEARVIRAAEAALEDHQYVSAVDVLAGMQLVAPVNVEAWREGRIKVLEALIQGSYEKVAKALDIFRRWAIGRGLKPVEARYVRATPAGEVELQIIGRKYAGLEEVFRTQYVSPELSERKQQKLQERLGKPAERAVFLNRRDSACSECGVELPSGSFLYMEANQPLCLACAGMGDLEFLPRGDTALTRRATKYSPSRAVVVEFSRSRGRYDRQGILVAEAALRQAEEECAADAPARARARERAAEARQKQDAVTVEQMTARIQALFPGCPPAEARHIAAHTAVRSSGRVGRSEAGRRLDSDAVTLAVQAAVRHRHTNYDELLAQGLERASARAAVRGQIDQILDAWRWGV
ncbi:conserved hypothetical protein [Candidatus Sulfopaludibacter sp. SbA4]|nr:conserved hypothetical protein [Candidatus Sulfopaludibacter sp. SbA4]